MLMGSKVEKLSGNVFDRFNNQYGEIKYSHHNPPSYGNPDGVHIYTVGDKKVAERLTLKYNRLINVIIKLNIDPIYL